MIKRAPIIAGAIVMVLILLMVMVFVLPMNAKVGTAEEELTTAQTAEGAIQLQLAALEELKKNAPEYQRQIDANEALIPKKADLPGLIRLLGLAADRAGVDFSVLSTSTPATATAGTYSTMSVAITVSGSFFQLAQYLWELERLPRAIKVTTTSLAPSAYPLMTASVSTEAFTTDTSSGPGSQAGSQDGAAPVPTPPATTP